MNPFGAFTDTYLLIGRELVGPCLDCNGCMSINEETSEIPFLDPDNSSATDAFDDQGGNKSAVFLAPAEGGELVAAPSSETEREYEVDFAKSLEQFVHGIKLLEQFGFSEIRQTYPVILALMWSLLVGGSLAVGISCITSINNLPVLGGVFEKFLELAGFAWVARFAASKLLLHQTRAELFSRIAKVKKDLLR